MKELNQIAKELLESYNNINENDDFITKSIREKLKEIPDNAPTYICPSCKTSIDNKVFKLQEGKCPTCSENVEPLYENINDILFNEKRWTCPNCKTTRLYKINESSECQVCHHSMDVYVPYVKPKKG